MITDLNVPLELAVMLCALSCVAGAWIGTLRAARQPGKPNIPLAHLVQAASFDAVIDLATRRNAVRDAAQAVLHGRIAARDGQGPAHDQIAAVLRAGLRRDDRLTHIDGDGFTIILPGADEHAGTRIAGRLRGSLSQMKINARFGVAAGDRGVSGDLLARRARRALDAGHHGVSGHVVAASDFEEVLFLPPPAASAA